MNPHLSTRRKFLRTGVLGAAASTSVPAFLERTFAGMHTAAAASATQFATGKDSPIFVIIQLAGGNDGLNTIVPWGHDEYYTARERISIPEKDITVIDDEIGFAPSIPYIREAYDNGEMTLVQGVGYPNPNRSHFRSTEIWEQATDSNRTSRTGWLGRYFDNDCQGADPTVGIALANQQPDAFVAEEKQGISLNAPELYKWIDNEDDHDSRANVFEQLNEPSYESMSEAGSSTGNMTAGTVKDTGLKSAADTLDFLERTALDARVSSDTIGQLIKKSKSRSVYPNTPIGKNLQLISRMIEGGLSTRVYYASHGGFDTHTNQTGSHPTRLGQLDESLRAFFKDIKAQGNFDRVVLMTFSEFGRRVKENGSGGTDHGAAAPLFLFGGGIKPGVVGKHPSLTDLHQGDLKYSIDFRSVYASVLDNWLAGSSKAVLGGEFPKLDLFKKV